MCTHWIGAEGRRCGAAGARLYLPGLRCPSHTPSALAGRPEPPEDTACAPNRCYCGEPTCPAYATYELRHRYDTHADAWPAIDARAIASGKRRSGPTQHAAARAAVAEQRDRDARLRRTT
jgi:hypothetical protein